MRVCCAVHVLFTNRLTRRVCRGAMVCASRAEADVDEVHIEMALGNGSLITESSIV